MPDDAHQECRAPRCPNYAVRKGFCRDYQRHYLDQTRRPGGANLTNSNRRFRWMRKAFLSRHPMCKVCGVESATVLDHRIPHRGMAALFWDQANWQGLCKTCHGRKTARETLGSQC
jgi:5-methylcytosine-specific restriction protein A